MIGRGVRSFEWASGRRGKETKQGVQLEHSRHHARRAPGSLSPHASDAAAVSDREIYMEQPAETPFASRAREKQIENKLLVLRLELLSTLSSMDTGLGAKTKFLDRLAWKIEQMGEPVNLKEPKSCLDGPSCLDQLAGAWRLIYSTGFTSGAIGGHRPGPPHGLLPATLGQVYQQVDPDSGRLDNIVEFIMSLNPSIPVPMLMGQDRSNHDDDSSMARLTIRHGFKVVGARTVQINKYVIRLITMREVEGGRPFACNGGNHQTMQVNHEKTSVEFVGVEILASLPKVSLPELPGPFTAPYDSQSSTFDITYLDDFMLVTRDKGAGLQIYLRDKRLDPVSRLLEEDVI